MKGGALCCTGGLRGRWIQGLVDTKFQAPSEPEKEQQHTQWVELLARLELELKSCRPCHSAPHLGCVGMSDWDVGKVCSLFCSAQAQDPLAFIPRLFTSLNRPAGCVLCAQSL